MTIHREDSGGTLHEIGTLYREDSSGTLHELGTVYRETSGGTLILVYPDTVEFEFLNQELLTLLDEVTIDKISRVVDKDTEDLFTISESMLREKSITTEESLLLLDEVEIDKLSRLVDKDAVDLFTVAEAITRDKDVTLSEALLFLENVTIDKIPRNTQVDAEDLFVVSESITLDIHEILAAPTNLVASGQPTLNEFSLVWDDNATDEDGFEIERSTDGVNFSLYDTIAANSGTGQVQYSSQSMPDGTYYWRVRATRGIDRSDYSNIDSDTV